MEHGDLQLENGNYTRIVNRVLDELAKAPLLGAELAVCIFVLRKTYGFNKKEDEISLTQFEQGTGRSRPTIVKALKNLQLVKILKLVKVGDSKKCSSCWLFNKYYDTWELVKLPKLVKNRTSTSKEKLKQLVKTPKHTKDNIQKTSTKDIASRGDAELVSSLIDLFKEVNPTHERLFGQVPQRQATERLLDKFGQEKLSNMIKFLPKSNASKYAPTITTPAQLERDLGKLVAWSQKQKDTKKPIIAFV